MKLNTSALRVALLFCSLLLPLNTPSAQKHKHRNGKRPKVQTTKAQAPSPTPTPQAPTLEGTYTLEGSSAATKTISEAIDAAVDGMGFISKRIARNELRKKNLPPPQQITISFTKAEVNVTTELAGTIQTPINGVFVKKVVRGDKLDVSTRWKDGKLERTFRTGKGERVNTYSLSNEKRTLTMGVTVTSSRLPRHLLYELNYRRL
jgi:hypothetical protein